MGWNGSTTYGVRVDSARVADTLSGLYVHSGRNNEANKVVRTDSSGYLQTGYINCSNGDENNASNPDRVWGTNGSDQYMRTYRTSSMHVQGATKINPLSGDSNYKLCYTADGQRTNAGEWGRAVMRYEPNGQTYGIRVDRADYADSAGNADTVDGYHASSLMGGYSGGQSFSGNGYQKLANGFTIQWGTYSGATGGTCYFPVAFANICCAVSFIGRTGCVIYGGSTPNTSSFYWHDLAYAESQGIRYIAVGY